MVGGVRYENFELIPLTESNMDVCILQEYVASASAGDVIYFYFSDAVSRASGTFNSNIFYMDYRGNVVSVQNVEDGTGQQPSITDYEGYFVAEFRDFDTKYVRFKMVTN